MMKVSHPAVAVAGVLVVLAVVRPAPVQTQPPSLMARIAALEARVATLESVENDNSALQAAVAALQNKLQYVTVAGTDMYITGANLNIRDGSGVTNSGGNGRGNLIVGYNENLAIPKPRTGSHNLVVGSNHGYTSIGGFVAGYDNTITGVFPSVSGGASGTASGQFSSVSGGFNNTASGHWSWVGGGQHNIASGENASISGGIQNTASGWDASVSGGYYNTASGQFSSVSGGTAITNTDYSGWSGGTYHTP